MRGGGGGETERERERDRKRNGNECRKDGRVRGVDMQLLWGRKTQRRRKTPSDRVMDTESNIERMGKKRKRSRRRELWTGR